MIRRKMLVAILICCLTVTSCIGFAPDAFAGSTAVSVNIQDENIPGDDFTGSEDDDPADPEDTESDVPEQEVQPPVINDWDDEGFYHGADGGIVKSCNLSIKGKVYKFDKDGASVLYTGTLKSEDGTSYYYRNGVKFTGTRTLDGKTYYYKNGRKYTGVRVLNSKPYYYKNGKKASTVTYVYKNKCYKNGKVYTGVHGSYYYNKGIKVTKYKNKVRKMSNGKFYYFNKNGTVFKGTGWKRVNGNRYYIKKGTAYTGWHYVGNYKYYFHKNTASLCQDLIACQGSKWKKKNLMIKVNRKKNIVTIYAKDGSKGYTIPVKALICSVGKKDTPTIKGTYILEAGSGKTYRWHVLGGPALGLDYSYGQYCVRIHRSWLFHSVTYDKADNRTLQTHTYNDLGKAASHGCIRLQVKDAKLIYDIVKYRDTKVKIFDSDWVGPFDKPSIKKIPSGQKYDPTDPGIKKK